ncbi:MAG: MFS transporter [Chloroflexota bacterium]
MLRIIGREFPLFVTFYFSSLGFGGMQMARPLFSASMGADMTMIAFVSTASAFAGLIGSPVAGALTDRWGRRPLVIFGLGVRVLTGFTSFFATSYEQFLAMEFVGSLGLAFWNTGVSVIVADVISPENRGRAIALRTASQRLGILCGPLIAGVLAFHFGLTSIFLLNAGTKLIALLIFAKYIAETRPVQAKAVPGTAAVAPAPRPPLSVFLQRPFLVLGFTNFIIYLMSQGGAFESLFPVHVTRVAGLSTVEIGYGLSLLNLISFLVSFPGGTVTDRVGRKAVLLPGMLLLGLGTFLLAGISDYWMVMVALFVIGMGDGLSSGAVLVLAMDMAPPQHRGVFLGVWGFIERSGGVLAPVAMGAVAQAFSIPAAFTTVTGCMVVAAVVMGLFGPETRVRRPVAPAG